jgi:hypothetical protein
MIALTDCSPIVMAHELGFFKKFGINSVVSKEASRAVIRDKLSLGKNQATHMLIGMPFASTMGLVGSLVKPMVDVREKHRRTVVMVTHDINEALYLADRLILMTDGLEAGVGEILEVPFARPRSRSLASGPLRMSSARARVPRPSRATVAYDRDRRHPSPNYTESFSPVLIL